jgi:hypothetical protein
MKFDIFKEETWLPSVKQEMSEEQLINAKAVGSIGNLIGKLQSLRYQIEQAVKTEQSNSEYEIARYLESGNFAAFQIMEVQITYNDSQADKILQHVNVVLNFWKRTQERNNWRSIMPDLKELQPFLQNDCDFKTRITPTVTGNSAWKAYLRSEQLRRNIQITSRVYDCDDDDIEEDRDNTPWNSND